MGETRPSGCLDLAVIRGDGIGPEVVAEGLKVLGAVTGERGPKVTDHRVRPRRRRWHATGETLPESVLDELRGHDAILLGAIGDPSVPERRPRARAAAPAALRARPLREPAPRPALPRRQEPAGRGAGRPGRHRLRRRPRGHRGPLRRQRRRAARRHPARDRHRGQRQHRVRRRARRARRLRPRRRPDRAGTSRSCTSTTCSPTPATSGAAPSRRSAPSSPT